ncbi:MAG TPA: ThiF family adenylyltransferase [Thermoanaerobaculia bacterium]|nr:ThiF family adenylyltransferase [Thermoanaerobaculia bacterium]
MNRPPDDRYSRQVLFRPLGAEGQARLRAARVLVAGCGGLGAESASLLARAGVGFLRIVDRDVVELSNLQRQALFDEADVREGLPKAVAAARRLARVNSDVAVEPIVADIGPRNVRGLLDGVDLVVDGFDSFEARFLMNDACVETRTPLVYGACIASTGLAALLVPGVTPCLRCLLPELPEPGSAATCDTAGILGPAAHLAASMQVGRALRYLSTGESPPEAELVYADVWEARFTRMAVPRDPACPCCAGRQFDFLSVETPQTAVLCGRDSVQVRPLVPSKPDFATLAERLRTLGEVVANDWLLRFRTEDAELTLFSDGRAVVKGTNDPARARSLVARTFGV